MRTARLENDSRIVFADRERMTPLGSNHPWPPPLFQMRTTSFWNTAATSGRPSPVPIPETSRSGDMTSLGVATGVPRPGRTLSWDGGEAGSARTGCRQSCRPCRSRNHACNEPGRLASAPESVSVQTLLPHPARAAETATPDSGEIRIQSLGDRDGPDPVLLQDPDVVQAVHQ